ncbi:ALQxL family class IV lanthipeptide [Kitasatospora azatica]|nr:ALQxL family class IV lanthipeptide [Kitasatospora azatica]
MELDLDALQQLPGPEAQAAGDTRQPAEQNACTESCQYTNWPTTAWW